MRKVSQAAARTSPNQHVDMTAESSACFGNRSWLITDRQTDINLLSCRSSLFLFSSPFSGQAAIHLTSKGSTSAHFLLFHAPAHPQHQRFLPATVHMNRSHICSGTSGTWREPARIYCAAATQRTCSLPALCCWLYSNWRKKDLQNLLPLTVPAVIRASLSWLEWFWVAGGGDPLHHHRPWFSRATTSGPAHALH